MTAAHAHLVAGLLVSTAPRPEFAERLSMFEPLIGSWDLAVTDYDKTGQMRASRAEWHFSWGLDGRAVLDVWISPRRDAADRRDPRDGPRPEWGLSVRFYDPDGDQWRSTWIGPGQGLIRVFTAIPTSDGLRLTQVDETGIETRWTFLELTQASFRWRNENHHPDGSTILRQTFDARRVGTRGDLRPLKFLVDGRQAVGHDSNFTGAPPLGKCRQADSSGSCRLATFAHSFPKLVVRDLAPWLERLNSVSGRRSLGGRGGIPGRGRRRGG